MMTYDAKRVELHRISDDRTESVDVASQNPEVVSRLTTLALEWKQTLPKQPDPACISKEAPVSPKAKPTAGQSKTPSM